MSANMALDEKSSNINEKDIGYEQVALIPNEIDILHNVNDKEDDKSNSYVCDKILINLPIQPSANDNDFGIDCLSLSAGEINGKDEVNAVEYIKDKKQEPTQNTVLENNCDKTLRRRNILHAHVKKDNYSLTENKPVLYDKDTNQIDPKSSPARDTVSKKIKHSNILKNLSLNSESEENLKQLAISRGGLLSDDLRIKAWPKLLKVNATNIAWKPDQCVLHAHRDYEQVVLDVNRSLKRFPPGMAEEIRMSMQDQLVDCIMRVLVDNEDLHYYQGYHDIVVTFLLVVGEDITFALMRELSANHLRDFMHENMEKTSGMLHFLYPLIGRSSLRVRTFMEKAEVGTMFCLPWLITWYGHVLNDIKHIVRLYDFFIACHPLMPIYLAAAIVLYREEDILKCEPEMPFIHCLLSNIPEDLPFEQLISEAGDLFVHFPPVILEKEAKEQYEKYQTENQRKQKELEKLKNMRALRQKKQSVWSLKNIIPSKSSILVKVSVWTGAALISAAAISFINNYYVNIHSDSWMDVHWLLGGK